MNIEDIKRLPISELNDLAKKLEVPGASGMRRQDLIFAILQTQAEQNGVISGSGVLEILVCPQCHGKVHFDEKLNGIICEQCKLIYEVKDDIPVMLVEEAKKLS